MRKSNPLLILPWAVLCVGVVTPSIATADNLMPRIVHEACTEFARGRPYTISARFEDESQLFDPKVIYRTRPNSHWKHASFKKDGNDFHVVLPAKEMKRRLEYFIEVFDEYGNGPARMGSPEAPIKLVAAKGAQPCEQIPASSEMVVVETSAPDPTGNPEEPAPSPVSPVMPLVELEKTSDDECSKRDRPLYCEPWLWGGVGAVILTGVGIGVYFLAFDDGGSEPNSPKQVDLQIYGPNVTSAP